MFQFFGSPTRAVRFTGFAIVLLASCAEGVKPPEDETIEQGRDDAHNAPNHNDAGSQVEGDGNDAGLCPSDDAGAECRCAQDSDKDGVGDCDDACPFAPGTTLIPWYADCDGDGQASSAAQRGCADAPPAPSCKDGNAPLGGFVQTRGTDCDDEDNSTAEERDYYPDCDGDGIAQSLPIHACGFRAASAAFDCAHGEDPLGGFWFLPGIDCNDEDVNAAQITTLYPDCDGDGVGKSESVMGCGSRPISPVSPCADGKAPDGGFLLATGTDCNDEDPAAVKALTWFPDCDGDGVTRAAGIVACGTVAARAAFDCADGSNPKGGFSVKQGADCNDEDRNASTVGNWYPDCDGDGSASSSAISACGSRGASVAFKCANGSDPKGGFLAQVGTDCNDEDRNALKISDFYPDCDGDGVRATDPVRACGVRGAETLFNCADGQDPDGNFSLVRGSDCNDEDKLASTLQDWYPDCDGDLVAAAKAVLACGARGASLAFNCADGADPDGGFASSQGTDCNDEDKSSSTPKDWYPDCDADGLFASTATRACGVLGANAAFDCKDGKDPDGGFSTAQGDDCNDENRTLLKATTVYADCDGDGEPTSVPTLLCGIPAVSSCRDKAPPDGGYDSVAGVDCNDELASNPCPCGYQDDDGDGVCALPIARSCLEILQRDATAADGSYAIDPDANASTPLITVSCEMSKGGFTVIARDTFAAGPQGWRAADGSLSPVDSNSTCATAFSAYLGGPKYFGQGAQTSKTYNLLSVPHTELSISLDYIVIDSWDSESALVSVDSVERFRASYATSTGANVCGSGWGDWGPQAINAQFSHSKNSAVISVSSTLNQASSDESFGVDNVVVRVR